MTTPSAPRLRVVLFAALAAVAAGLSLGSPTGAARQPPPGEPPRPVAGPAPAGDRPADKDAVRKALDGFVAAFRKGDAGMVAASWTPGGEYTSDDGTTYRGRPALQKAYAELFAKSPENALEVEVGTIHFPSRDTAVVEGHFKLRPAKGGELAVSRCSFLYAREDGTWRIAIAREWPGDGLSVRDLEWLIGTWEAGHGGTTVTTIYEWTPNKSFIRCRFSVAKGGDTDTGTQMIGKDPATGGLRVWTFEDEGGVGLTEITRDGERWVFAAHGTTAGGQVLTATNILTPLDADSFLWHAVERRLDDEPQPDLPPVRVTRVKAKP